VGAGILESSKPWQGAVIDPAVDENRVGGVQANEKHAALVSHAGIIMSAPAPVKGSRIVRVGIVGCGHVSLKHIDALRKIRTVKIVGTCDRDAARGREAARRAGTERVYSDLDRMLHEAAPDVVHVVTPPRTHRDLSIRAMNAGCHVLVEKPMAVDAREADEMIAAARAGAVELSVCHNFLFERSMLRARRLVSEGAVGTIVSIDAFWRIKRGGPDDRYAGGGWIHELPGGVFHEVAPHPLYLVAELLEEPRIASALVKSVGVPDEAPSELRVQLEGKSALGSVAVSVRSEPHQAFVNIHGTRSTLQVDLASHVVIRVRGKGSGRRVKFLTNLDQSGQLLVGTVANTARVAAGRMTFGHENLIRRFYDSLERGGEPPVTAEQGRAIVALLDEIRPALDGANAGADPS
jgi:predicted dehydrogenase